MAYEHKPNSGSSFENMKKIDSRHPDFTGSALVGGVEYFFDMWRNTTGDGREFFNAKFKPKDKQPGQQFAQVSQPVRSSSGGDVPF